MKQMILPWFWTGIAIILGIILYYGYTGSRRSSSISEHQIPRGALGAGTLGFATAATQTSPATFLGVAGFAYVSGLSGLWWILLVPFVFTAGLALVAKVFHRMGTRYGSLSVPDWMGSRYNSNVLCVIVAILFLVNIFYVISQFVGMALILNATGGVPYKVALLIGALLVGVYVLVGGNYAVVKTDAWQTVIMATASVVVFVGIILVYTSIPEINRFLADESPNLVSVLNPESPVYSGVLALFGIIFLQGFLVVQPHIGNRFLMVDKTSQFKTLILCSGAASLLLTLSAVTGLAARAHMPALVKTPDQSPLVVVNQWFPTIFAALFSVAVVAAAISTANAVMSSIGAGIGNDLYRRLALRHGQASSEAETARVNRNALRITRMTILVVTVVAVVIAWEPPDLLALVAALGLYLFLAGVAGPLVLGLFWSGATKAGAFAATIGGPVIFVLLHYVLEIWANIFINGGISIAAGFGLMFFVSVATAKSALSSEQSLAQPIAGEE